MKKFIVFSVVLCAVCSALGAQVFYEGQGGGESDIRVSEIVSKGERLSNDEAVLLPLIQLTLSNDFNKYTRIEVADLEDKSVITEYTLTGTITKTNEMYYLEFTIVNSRTGIKETSYGPMQCTFRDLQTLKAIKKASEELITGMGVTLTQAGRNALRTTATNEAEAMNALAKSAAAGATSFEKAYYTYQASQLDPTLAEAARRLAAYQTEIYKAPEINLAMPDIKIPEIKAPEFKAPEIRMVATGNIGADARRQQEQYENQREISRLRQESGNQAMKDLQDAFLAQFKVQSEAVKKQQADLMGQRNILLGQQRTLLERQRQMIAQLHETENSYATFFTEHPPFEIIYNPVAALVGIAQLEPGTRDLQFPITSVGTPAMQVIPLMLADFEKGLETIARGLKDINAEFDKIQSLLAQVEAAGGKALPQLVKDYATQMAKVEAAEKNYTDQLVKLDTALKTTGYAQLGRDYAVRPDTAYAERLAGEYAVQSAGYNAAGDKKQGDTWTLTRWNRDETRTFSIKAVLENEEGKTIGTASVNLTNKIFATAYTQPMSYSTFCVFRDVQVNDITDTLKVSIQQVNGRNVTAEANSGYIKISPLEADGYTKDGLDIDGYDKNRRNQMGLTRQEAEKPQREADKAAAEADQKAWWAAHHFALYPWYFQAAYIFQPGYSKGFRIGGYGLYGAFSFSDETHEEMVEDKNTEGKNTKNELNHYLITIGYAFNIIDNWLIIPIGAGFRSNDKINNKPHTLVMELGYEIDLGANRRSRNVFPVALSVFGTYRLIDFKEHSFSIGAGLVVREGVETNKNQR